MYQGWLSFAGIELANVSRLVAYKNALLPTLNLKDCGDCPEFAEAMGDDPYDTPTTDDAEWVDLDRPESMKFLGFLPTSMSGFTDSTRTNSTTEAMLDGGATGRTRRATREMRVTGWLIGASQPAAEAGFSWMKAALDGSACSDCEPGDDLCFLMSCPTDETLAGDFTRHLRRVTCMSGPTRVAERPLHGCGGYMIQIEFGFVAATPFVYTSPTIVATAAGSTLTKVHPNALVQPMSRPLRPCLTPALPASILKDPDCATVPDPPTAPALFSACKPLSFNAYDYVYNNAYVPVATAPGALYEARSQIATDGLNTVVAWSEAPTVANSAGTKVMVRKRANSGAWGTATVGFDEGSSTRGVTPAGLRWVPSKGKYMMGALSFPVGVIPPMSPSYYQAHFLTSSDGVVWTQVSTLTAAVTAANLPEFLLTHIAHFDNGTTDGVTYAVGHGRQKVPGGTWRVYLFRSLNFGGSWSFMGKMTPDFVPEMYWPRLAIWPDGEILVTISTYDASWNLYMIRSKNGGVSWTYPRKIISRAGRYVSTPIVTNDDGLLLLYSDMTNPGSRNWGETRSRISKDRGLTWAAPKVWTHRTDFPTVGNDGTVLPDGSVAATYSMEFGSDNAHVYETYFTQVKNYLSYAMYVPDSVLKTWQEGVLSLQIKTGTKATRQMRVRLLPRPLDNQLPEDLDPCSTCGSFIIDYVPANTIVNIDGMTERITMKVGSAAPAPADHLVSGEGGGLFEWPIFTCGMGYYVLVDVDVNTIISLSLGVVNRE